MNSVIKLYSPESELSYIADEIYDLRNNIKSLKIELRDKISLNIKEKYELSIIRGDLIRVKFSFVYHGSDIIRVPIDYENELKLQSLRSKNPFKIKLSDENNNCLAIGLFYRYKTRCRFTRSTNPRDWDPSFFPERHKIYGTELTTVTDSEFSIPRHISNELGSKKDNKKNFDEQKFFISDEINRNFKRFYFDKKNFQEFFNFFIKFTVLYVLFDIIKLVFSHI